ncbi:MAG: DUF4956 domain-containing protein [Thioploca sp.]|nr:DUF4956 domain-containing protein [Thioploca sp.]
MFESSSATLDMAFFIRFAINLLSLFVLVRLCYYRKSPNRDFLFSFYLFGIGVFFVTRLLHNVDVSMGFAFSLFAIFSMLRYRTESISIKEMTYLFLVIGIALLSAVSQINYWELLLINLLISGFAAFAESLLFMPNLTEKTIQYEKIDNIKPQNRELLLADLKQRTGLNIQTVQIENIDFLRDTALLKIYYLEEEPKPILRPTDISHQADEKIRASQFSIK